MKKTIVFFIFSFLFLSCTEAPNYEDCMGFCDLMESLSCPEHLGSPGVDSDYKTVDDNISCEEMCELYIDAITLDCYNNVTTCDELRECE